MFLIDKNESPKQESENASFWGKRSIYIVRLGAIILLIVGIFSYFYFVIFTNKAGLHDGSKIGLVTDMHGGGTKERVIDGVIMGYPGVYKQHFSAILEEMKKQGINLVIALGDNTEKGKIMNAETLVEIAKNKGMEVVWVKGNHDRVQTDVMKTFGVEPPYYYYVDKGEWRIVILDSSGIDPAGTGGIDDQQMDWLKNTLTTDKSVIIAMHHPIYSETDYDVMHEIYERFKKEIEKAGNVRYVLSGHYHHEEPMAKVSNGITYKTIMSLVFDENKPSFEILTLKK